MGKHTKFILRPTHKILDDAVSAIVGSQGIARIPLNEYFLQSVFLRMTGEQEQKMKCICWELATDDYDYRYERYNNGWKLGECSTLKDKNTVYNDLYEHVSETFIDDNWRQNIINKTKDIIREFYFSAQLNVGNERVYLEFQNVFDSVKKEDLLQINRGNVQIFSDKIKKMYESLYKHRNRCAHNTLSYQEHPLPFPKMSADESKYENYFLRFALLIMIDKIFIDTYYHYSS